MNIVYYAAFIVFCENEYEVELLRKFLNENNFKNRKEV